MALTALRKVTSANQEVGMLVTRDQLPGMRVLARLVFAEIILALADVVVDCNIDEGDISAPHPYSAEDAPTLEVTLRFPTPPAEGKLMAIRRQLEHAVAVGMLAMVATEADGDFATSLRTKYLAIVDTLSLSMGCTSVHRLPGWP